MKVSQNLSWGGFPGILFGFGTGNMVGFLTLGFLTGGTLRVKHFGQTVDFAWASQDPKTIQWAAFYGDCEHEVLEVIAGHRVTLTYNLYYTPVGNLALPMSDPTKLPLYDTVAQILREPSFMPKGGNSVFCD